MTRSSSTVLSSRVPQGRGTPESVTSRRLHSDAPAPLPAMTSQGSAHGRFARALKQRNLFMAEMALREMQPPSLLVLLDYLALLVREQKHEKARLAAIRWHGRLELEARAMTLDESRLALNALELLCDGNVDLLPVLQRLLRRVQPTAVQRFV